MTLPELSTPPLRYGAAVAAVLLATVLQMLLQPLLQGYTPFACFFVAVLVAALLGGMGPALLALGLSLISAGYFFVPPYQSLIILQSKHIGALVVYLIVGLAIAGLAEKAQQARREAEAAQRQLQAEQQAALDLARDRQETNEELEVANEELQSQADELVRLNEALQEQQRRQAFLTAVSTALVSSLDYETTLDRVARLIVGSIADFCVVDLVEADGQFRRVATAHADPAREALAQALRRYPPERDSQSLVARVLRSDAPEIRTPLTDESRREAARDEEHLRLLRELDGRSSLLVPLVARGRRLGVLSCVFAESGREYGPSELALAEELALRAALAIDNARLYRELEAADQEKRESLSLLDSLLAHAPVGFAFFDREHRYVRINSFLAAINGLPVEAHLGRSIRELLPVNADAIAPVLDHVFSTGEAVSDLEVTGETAREPGVERHWLTAFYPVRTAAGEVRWVGAVVMEITERKQLEQSLERQAVELAAADRRKDRFLATLGHELRNPLAALSNALHLLAARAADPALTRPRELMERQVRQLVRLTDDLMDVSRVSQGKIQLQPTRLDLAQLTRDAVGDMRGALEQAGLALVRELPEQPVWVDGDPARLTQVIVNLVRNAVKYTDPGGQVRVRLEVEAAAPGPSDQTQHPTPSAVLTVQDTGIGIEPEMLPRIFEPFAQVEETRDRSRGGLGLGLALVKGLVERHGGHVSVASEGPGHGTTVTVRLPLASP